MAGRVKTLLLRVEGVFVILAAGAALLGLHALGGLMLTPFFGATPIFWATVVLSAPLSLSLGLVAGQPAARLAARRPWVPNAIAAAAGLLVLAVPVVLAPLSRAILDRDPDSRIAAPLTVLILITIPSAAAAATLPGVVERTRPRPSNGGEQPKPRPSGERTASRPSGGVRASGSASGERTRSSASGERASPSGRTKPDAPAPEPPPPPPPRRSALSTPGVPLLLFSLGGIGGIAACAPALLDPDRFQVWIPIWGFGWGLLLTGAFGLGQAFGSVVIILGAALVPVFLGQRNEVRDHAYEKAMKQAWRLGVGRYYLDTAGRRVLDRSEVARKYAALHDSIAYASDKSIAAVLIVETLRTIGPATITGDGLREIFDLYLPVAVKPRVFPIVDKIAAVRSDGKGEIGFSLRRLAPDEDIEVTVPNEQGEPTTIVFTGDFTLSIHVDRVLDETRTTVDFGPLEVEKAGFLSANDTFRTPVQIKDAALFFDAHLLGFNVISRKERVVVLVRAQGSVGGIKTEVLQIHDLAKD